LRVTTSCSGRFHIFDQARELDRLGFLHRLVCDYPRQIARRWGIPGGKVVSLLANGLLGRAVVKIGARLSLGTRERLTEIHHSLFSRRLVRHIPPDTEVFIGLSSYCLEALRRAKENGVVAIVDHGSLHQRTERLLVTEELERLGLAPEEGLAPAWIIEKEDEEFHAADRVMVLSRAAKKSLVKQGVSEKKIFVNPCGVDLSQFTPIDGAADGVFRIIYCGSVSLRKGVHYLLQAFAELNIGNAELWLIGTGPSPSFNRLIAKYRSDKVRFLGTFPQNELRRMYAKGSAFVLPSLADGFGMVVPQAMACGLPVIVTENVGAADVVTDGVDGFVVPIRDVAMLKEKLLFFKENPEAGRAMGQAARRTVESGFTWADYGARLGSFLEGSRAALGAGGVTT
jgi:glycosyltransferase involved in cell wall biosynthesis